LSTELKAGLLLVVFCCSSAQFCRQTSECVISPLPMLSLIPSVWVGRVLWMMKG